MMAEAVLAKRGGGLGRTDRRDLWWIGPLGTAFVLAGFVIYAVFRTLYSSIFHVFRILA
jgi:hypothetical protein